MQDTLAVKDLFEEVGGKDGPCWCALVNGRKESASSQTPFPSHYGKASRDSEEAFAPHGTETQLYLE